jgi:GTPase SAR1 family protein
VGKTSFISQFVNSEFAAQYSATSGSDFSFKRLGVDEKSLTLQVCDLSGWERFRVIGPTFYRGTDG